MSVKSSFRSGDDELDRLVGLGITRQQVESGDDCLDPEVLASYADGGLSEAERAEIDNHLARCRDCRRALALLLESAPASVGAAPSLPERHPGKADDWRGSTSRSRVLHSAKIWLPLAAALVVATGLWFAIDRSRQFGGSAPADMLQARNESSTATRPAPQEGAAPQRGQDGARPSASAPAPAPNAASAARRAREARRDGFVAARPEAEADKPVALARPAAPAPSAAAPAPPPLPPPAALADAARARSGAAAGRDAQAAGAGGAGAGQAVGQVAGQVAPSPAQAPAAPPAQDQTVVDAMQAKQAAQANQAPQNVTQQAYVVNQQTGPMANMNVASPPPSKTDDRRQAEASKREANEKTSVGGPSSAKSADEKFAKVAEEPKAVARAKAAPESAAAAAPAESAATKTATTTTAKAEPSSAAAGASAASGGKASGAAGRAGATAPESTSAAASPGSARAADRSTAGAGVGDTGTREINEALTITTTGARAASPVLRSADGTRWWRIRVPGTIEGSVDRGATWTVEYSEPLSVIVRGAAGSKSGCWMIGRRGLVLRARPDGGWERVKQPTANGLVSVTATDQLIATVTDDRGRTYRTNDGGVTWR